MLPLGCFPLWGRERVTILTAPEDQVNEGYEDYNRAEKKDYFIPMSFISVLFFHTNVTECPADTNCNYRQNSR